MQKDKTIHVDLFVPCTIDQFWPETGFNMKRLLELAGCVVHYNTEQTCCGQPAFNAGFWDDAKEVGEKLIGEQIAGHYMVAASSGCVSMVRHSYNTLFENTSVHNPSKNLQKIFFDFAEFWVDVLGNPAIEATFNARVALLDNCKGMRDCKIFDQPRKLLGQVEGLELVEMKDYDTCCGFGGIFSVKFEPLSVALAEEKLKHVMDTGAEFLVCTDGGCLMHLDSYIKKNNLHVKAIHIVDLLVKGLK